MRKVAIASVIVSWLIFSATASAELITRPKDDTPREVFRSQTENLQHSRYVCKHGANTNQRWHCKAKLWLYKEWKKTYALLHPDIRTYVRTNHPCLAEIIAGENEAYDPTLDYGGGHGNTNEAYGIPQANPGYKMASAGPDWATNPFTQLKWMIGYVRSRYGGECEALAYRRAHGSY